MSTSEPLSSSSSSSRSFSPFAVGRPGLAFRFCLLKRPLLSTLSVLLRARLSRSFNPSRLCGAADMRSRITPSTRGHFACVAVVCPARVANLQVARQLLSSKEIARIWERGEYNEDEQTWVLPRIKPRASYVGDPYKLPLLTPPGAVNGGGGSSGSGSRVSVSGKDGGSAKRRRSVAGGRGGSEDRPPRRAGEETAPKEGGGGEGRRLEVLREGCLAKPSCWLAL